jgi:hypothetical protein
MKEVEEKLRPDVEDKVVKDSVENDLEDRKKVEVTIESKFEEVTAERQNVEAETVDRKKVEKEIVSEEEEAPTALPIYRPRHAHCALPIRGQLDLRCPN